LRGELISNRVEVDSSPHAYGFDDARYCWRPESRRQRGLVSHGERAVARHNSISYIRPGRLGEMLAAEAEERSRSGRSGIYDVRVTGSSDGAVVAEFRGHARLSGGRFFTDTTGPAKTVPAREAFMAELSRKTKDALNGAATSTLTGLLNRRGFNNMFLQEVSPLRLDIPRMVGFAYTMRFIPHRKDKSSPLGNAQQKAMEECPPGHVLVIDSRGDARAASAGDLYIGRLAARGCSGIVTDGGLRDSEGILKTGLPAYHRRPTSPPSPIVHQ